MFALVESFFFAIFAVEFSSLNVNSMAKQIRPLYYRRHRAPIAPVVEPSTSPAVAVDAPEKKSGKSKSKSNE